MTKRKNFILWLIFGLIFSAFSLNVHAEGVVTNCDYFDDKFTPGTLAWALEGGGDVIFECSGEIEVPRIVIETDTLIDANGNDVILSGGHNNIVLRIREESKLDLKGLKITKAKTSGTSGDIENIDGKV